MNYLEAIKIVDRGIATWKAQPHNAKWWRRIDGTPIPNDLAVCIAEAFSKPEPLPIPEMEISDGSGMLDSVRNRWVWLARLNQLLTGWAGIKVCNSPAWATGKTVDVFPATGEKIRGRFTVSIVAFPSRIRAGRIYTANKLPKGMRRGDMLVVNAG